jgi:succinyl-CoA synthetase beta subunit
MARRKISEYTAKKILFNHLGLSYLGTSISTKDPSYTEKIERFSEEKLYVVKVDQGVKGRFKKGLVKLQVAKDDLIVAVQELSTKGYTQFLIEEFVPYEISQEKYLAVIRTREGLEVLYSESGGVDIESHADAIQKIIVKSPDDFRNASVGVEPLREVGSLFIEKVLEIFEKYYFSFLEINPLIVRETQYIVLDLAVEVDSAAEFFVDHVWTPVDFIEEESGKTEEEKNIEDLKSKSQASFKLNVLNQNGSIFVLLSGGGASLVVADEVYNLGFGKKLANYGEYSGNPTEEETYLYTKNLLSLLLESQADKKVLIIGGGVANFTDVRITFRGIIQALEEVSHELQSQGVKVFVRRGGPNQEEGLAMMKEFLEKNALLGNVYGPEIVLTDIVGEAIESL